MTYIASWSCWCTHHHWCLDRIHYVELVVRTGNLFIGSNSLFFVQEVSQHLVEMNISANYGFAGQFPHQANNIFMRNYDQLTWSTWRS